jgi:phage terminase large subunit-like protein
LAFAPEPGVLELLPRFWVPEATIARRSKQDRVPYDAWQRDGWLIATPGDVVDYDFIRADVGRLAARFGIQEIGFDPWNATQIATQLSGDGLQMVEVRQGYKTLSEPCKEFEKLITAGRVRHGGHPILRWMVSNVSLRRDPNDNIAPDKSSSGDRIDGVVAAIMALSRQIVHPAPTDEAPIQWL